MCFPSIWESTGKILSNAWLPVPSLPVRKICAITSGQTSLLASCISRQMQAVLQLDVHYDPTLLPKQDILDFYNIPLANSRTIEMALLSRSRSSFFQSSSSQSYTQHDKTGVSLQNPKVVWLPSLYRRIPGSTSIWTSFRISFWCCSHQQLLYANKLNTQQEWFDWLVARVNWPT